MMTNRTKKKFYSWALYVILGLLVLPALFLAGCTEGPPPDPAPVAHVETADTKIRRQIRIDEAPFVRIGSMSRKQPQQNTPGKGVFCLVQRLGIEPRTLGLRGPCSTD